ncbi:MAG: hypothetical protein KatS3mg052_1078 [Candidatus Roseilinea sp.]|nr:MAG: hypothetical protein KatS3mg052_1078 [Candidatus Roseilinea sp.]
MPASETPPQRRGRFAALLGLLAAAALILSEISSSVAQGDAEDHLALLRAQAAQRGRLRIIATLNVNYRPERPLAGAEATAAQRAAIRAATARVLSRLAGGNYTVNATFEAYPFLGVTVDPVALEALLSSPDVLAVAESTLKRPADLLSNQVISANAAHNLGYTGSGYVVAVLDTGVQTSHPFLAGRTVAEACFSRTDLLWGSTTLCPNGQSTGISGTPGQIGPGAGTNCSGVAGCDHGTHVAGTAVGKDYSGGPGYNGVAPDAGLVAIQVFSKFTTATACGGSAPCLGAFDEDILAALQYVQTTLAPSYTIAAVNMSLGDGSYNATPCDSSPYFTAVANLRAINIATVIAAGNSGYSNGLSKPACVSNAISVGATTNSDAIASFSNRASYMSLFAPGVLIQSSSPVNSYVTKSGTSMAAPHVAGAWAVMRQRYPTEDVGQILTRLQTTGKPITFWPNTKSRIQLSAAMAFATRFMPIVAKE